MTSAGRYYRTISHLTGRQLWHFTAKRLLGPLTSSDRVRRSRVTPSLRPADPRQLLPETRRRERLEMLRTRRFSFLNRPFDVNGTLPWEEASLPLLWKMNLHYFDYADLAFTAPEETPLADRVVAMARDWAATERRGQGAGWLPYSVSLRVVNWLKFLVRNPGAAARPETAFMLDSAWEQSDFLARNLEFEFGANHLLKNAKALVFAGALLDAPEADGWQAKGEEILGREIERQILPDGGHYERSPMYHLQVLEDLLDLQALSRATGRALSISAMLEQRIAAMARFARAILHPDGEIPLFNDSALAVTRPTQELLALAEARSPKDTAAPPLQPATATPETTSNANAVESPRLALFADTGYAVIGEPASDSRLIFDCGALGPDSNPAHGHCDVLSYELSLYGQRVVTDTGVSTYERGPDRDYERSTAAHNTIRIDGEDQAEVWASFRVGRRPRVGGIEAEEVNGYRIARGAHFGYQRRGVVHARAIVLTPARAWVVIDVLTGRGTHSVESFIHFHPGVRLEPIAAVGSPPEPRSGAIWTLAPQWTLHFGGHRIRLATLNADQSSLEQTSYSPEFGIRQTRPLLRLTGQATRRPFLVSNLYAYAFVPEGAPVPGIALAGEMIAIDEQGVGISIHGLNSSREGHPGF